AIDRRALVEGPFVGVHRPAHAFPPPGPGGYDPPALAVYDPDLARRWLADTGPAADGWRPDDVLDNRSEDHQLLAELAQEDWRRELGLEATLASQEYNVFWTNRDTLNYDVCRASWFSDYLDPLGFLEILTTGNANNQTGWSYAEYDGLIAEARRTSDPAAR